jgi:predicted Rossmann fold flavoprotein
MKQYDVVVVGGGAAGMISALRAAEFGCRVLLVEKNTRPGVKLSITGKGRCNITNTASESAYYKHIHPKGRFLKHAFSRFFSADIIRLLEQLGVETKEERGGRVFPESNQAVQVVKALLAGLKQQKVEILYRTRVTKVLTGENGIRGIQVEQEGKHKEIPAQRVIICTGGKSYPSTGSNGEGFELARDLGHTVNSPKPALVPVETEETIPEMLVDLILKNVTARVWSDDKKIQEAFGEMFFTPYGLSGPIILTLSRFIAEALNSNKQVYVHIDLKPALDDKKLDNRLLRDINRESKKQMVNLFRQWLPSQLIPYFMEKAEIDPKKEANQLDARERKRIRVLMKNLFFTVKRLRPFREAIITAGGVSTLEINSRTLESKLIPNLYFAGEVIELYGDTGGYNLQIAWSTGWLAGESCAKPANGLNG